jgi:hypothetical protein
MPLFNISISTLTWLLFLLFYNLSQMVYCAFQMLFFSLMLVFQPIQLLTECHNLIQPVLHRLIEIRIQPINDLLTLLHFLLEHHQHPSINPLNSTLLSLAPNFILTVPLHLIDLPVMAFRHSLEFLQMGDLLLVELAAQFEVLVFDLEGLDGLWALALELLQSVGFLGEFHG